MREVDRKQKIYSFTRANRNSRRDPIKIRELVAKQMLARLIRWIAESKGGYYLYYHFRADEFHHKNGLPPSTSHLIMLKKTWSY